MNGSAIESEVKVWLTAMARQMRQRDRGVVLGMVFSFVPIPPVALAGLAIDVINLRLLAKGRLAERERGLIRVSVVAAFVCLIAGTLGFVSLALFAEHTMMVAVARLLHELDSVIDLIIGRARQPDHSGVLRL